MASKRLQLVEALKKPNYTAEEVGALTVDATRAEIAKARQEAIDISCSQAKTYTDSEIDPVKVLAAANKAAIEANAAAIALKADRAALDEVKARVSSLEIWHDNFVEVSLEEIATLFTS